MKIPASSLSLYDGKIIRFEIDFGPKKMTGIFYEISPSKYLQRIARSLIESDSQREKKLIRYFFRLPLKLMPATSITPVFCCYTSHITLFALS